MNLKEDVIMATVVPKDFPRCGACVYWGGKAEVHNDLVEYDMYESARCNNFDSPAHGNNVSADHSCFQKKDY
jgi:hypothetical protein